MKVQSEVVMVIEKGEHVYRFSMPVGAEFGEAYDAAFACLERVQEMSRQAVENIKNAEEAPSGDESDAAQAGEEKNESAE